MVPARVELKLRRKLVKIDQVQLARVPIAKAATACLDEALEHFALLGEHAEHGVVSLGQVQIEPARRGEAGATNATRVAMLRLEMRVKGGERGESRGAPAHAAPKLVQLENESRGLLRRRGFQGPLSRALLALQIAECVKVRVGRVAQQEAREVAKRH